MNLEEIFVANVMHHREVAGLMNIVTRKLIAKELYVSIAGCSPAGASSASLRF